MVLRNDHDRPLPCGDAPTIPLVVFVAIVAWAWSGKRKRAFDEASRIPLEDDDEATLRRDEDR